MSPDIELAHRFEDEKIAVVSAVDGEVESIVLDTINAEKETTEAEYKAVLRKIDLWLLPLMWITYGTQQADKTSISTQAVFGLREDLGLVGQQYSWLSTIFYLSYLVCEAPGNYLVQRTGSIGRFLGVCMFFWGIIVLCVAATKNWAGIMVLRAFQGALECTISPSFLLMTGTWYTAQEQTFRSIIWGTANAGMGIITGLINFRIGLDAQDHPGGLAPWKGVSLFLGSLTIVLSVLVFFILGTPREVRWLSDKEKRIAAARVLDSKLGSDRQRRSEWKWDQVKAAFRDPQTYFFFFTSIANDIPNGGITTFGSLVYQSFGFTSLEVLTKGTIPQNALSIGWFLLAGYVTLKRPNMRFAFMFFSLIPAFSTLLALALLPLPEQSSSKSQLWTRWGLYFLSVLGSLPGLFLWTLLPSNVAGRTKKTVTATVLFVAYCFGNSVGAQVFQDSDAPRYIHGLLACAILYGVDLVLLIAWRAYYVYENKRRDKIVRAMGLSLEEERRRGFIAAEMDATDTDNIFFRYSY